MGWFSAKKKIYVSSVVYNLAGGPEDRIRYLPSTIATKVISNTQFSMSETLQGALVNGPGMRLRKFARWARTKGYTDAVGQTAGRLSVAGALDINVIVPFIPVGPGETVGIQDAKIRDADYGAWADQWMLENHPEQVTEDYVIDFDESANSIYIRFEDSTVYSFTPVGFDINSQYLYVGYTLNTKNKVGPLVPGSATPGPFPDMTGWTAGSVVTTPKTTDLVTTTVTDITYSDGTPPESTTETTTTTGSYSEVVSSYSRTTFQGESTDGASVTSLREFAYLTATESVTSTDTQTTTVDGPKTTVVTITVESLVPSETYRIDTQEVIDAAWSTLHTMIYKKGSGNPALDALFIPRSGSAAFFPFIPLRRDNKFIKDDYMPELYAKNKKALTRSVGSDYDNLIKSVANNGSLKDIDYAYVTFGVSFNTKEDSSKKYIYKFFQAMRDSSGGGAGEFNAWRVQWNAADRSQRAWLAWKEAQGNPSSPLYGTPEPTKQTYPTAPTTRLIVKSESMNYEMWITWSTISETTGTGKAWEGAKTGEVRIQAGQTDTYPQLVVSGGLTDWIPNDIDFTTITWQEGANKWRSMGIWNLVHDNLIYRGKAVTIGAHESLRDPEESGFIVPMHEGVYRSMSLKDTNQMSMASGYMMFNCYQVVKQKWYQTSWFKIVLVIIVIVVTVLTAGAGGASAGLLGTAASVGAALGFAGTIAIIVGTIANAVAAMLLTQLLTMGATALFGEKVGLIVGAIASIIAINVGTSMSAGQSVATSFSDLSSAENILRLTVAAGKGISGYMDATTQATVQSTQDLLNEYSEAKTEIQRVWEQNLGFGNNVIDPTVLTDVTKSANLIPESADVFIGRTLLTGSEIAELTNSMLSNFVAMTITTQLPS